MALKDKIRTGKDPRPPRIMIYGTEGVGKSTTASKAPDPIFIPTEDGLGQIDCTSFPLARSLQDVLDALEDLRREKHGFRTVVIDSADWLERLVWDATCARFGVKNIEKVDGGYSKGYRHCLDDWRLVIDALDALRTERGMIVLLLAHAKVEKFEDPEAPAYDRYSPRLHKHAAAMITEWCDAVLFATRRLRTHTEDAGFNRTRTIAVGIGSGGGGRSSLLGERPGRLRFRRAGFAAKRLTRPARQPFHQGWKPHTPLSPRQGVSRLPRAHTRRLFHLPAVRLRVPASRALEALRHRERRAGAIRPGDSHRIRSRGCLLPRPHQARRG